MALRLAVGSYAREGRVASSLCHSLRFLSRSASRVRPPTAPSVQIRNAEHSTGVAGQYSGWTAWGPPPPAVFAIGLNYKKHALETGLPEPQFPVVFLKPSSSIIGDGEAIEIPSACSRCVATALQLLPHRSRTSTRVSA